MDINGKMTKKLLNTTLRVYLIFSLIVLVVSAPLFYFITEKLYLEDADETLYLRKKQFTDFTLSKMKENEISVWNKISNDGIIEKSMLARQKDSLFFETKYDKITAENEPYHVLKSSILIEGKPYTLILRVNLIESEDLIMSVVGLFSLIITLLLLGLFIITKRMSYKLWTPFYDTLNQIEQFEIDKHKKPNFSNSKIEEFHRLNEALSKLIENNIIIFKGQREFVENAAHELQTPLAIFQTTIEELIQNSEITVEQSELLDKLNNTASRLNRLNKNLLLLSKIDGNQYHNNEKVILNTIFEKQLDFFIEQANSKSITININLIENVEVKSNPVLVEILISNLFLNSIKHNVSNGLVNVIVTNTSILFSNTGSITPLDGNKLFQRFSKINPSTHGNGLGLAIIKKIVELNKWRINYTFQNNVHFFEIKF